MNKEPLWFCITHMKLWDDWCLGWRVDEEVMRQSSSPVAVFRIIGIVDDIRWINHHSKYLPVWTIVDDTIKRWLLQVTKLFILLHHCCIIMTIIIKTITIIIMDLIDFIIVIMILLLLYFYHHHHYLELLYHRYYHHHCHRYYHQSYIISYKFNECSHRWNIMKLVRCSLIQKEYHPYLLNHFYYNNNDYYYYHYSHLLTR